MYSRRLTVAKDVKASYSSGMASRNQQIKALYEASVLTVREIGEKFGISKQRVDQIARREGAEARGASENAVKAWAGNVDIAREALWSDPKAHANHSKAMKRAWKRDPWSTKAKRPKSAARPS